MFPIKDDNPTQNGAPAVYGIIILNIAAWFFLQGMGGSPGGFGSLQIFGLLAGLLVFSAGIVAFLSNHTVTGSE